MKSTCLGICIALSLPALAVAQSTTPADPISQAIRVTWEGAKRNIMESAQQMPEADYAFKPVDSVRSFGAILAHIAGADYVFCAPARGEKTPYEEDHFEKSVTTKADIVKALNDSIAYCDAAYKSLSDRTAAEGIGTNNAARATTLIRNTGHLQEHYGNLVTYFRIKGMVPPSSRGR